VIGEPSLVDARVDAIQDDRQDVELSLPVWLRIRAWWRRRLAVRIEDGLHELAAARSPVRMVAPMLMPVLLVPAIVILREPGNALAMLCLVCGALALVYALAADTVERWFVRTSWIRLGNVVFYAALISIILATFVTLDHPREHLHWVVFFFYFLLIGSIGLTDDPRQAVAAGCVSLVGYCGVIVFAHHAAAGGNPLAARLLVEFDWVANSAKLAMLAGASVVAVASAERGRELRRLSMRDGLTGLLNRRAFDDCLERLAEHMSRRKTALTIAMIDIDHFKKLNDAYGHATGDVVLRWVASRIERSFRSGDLVARYGGEEFVVALPDTNDACVLERLEVLRAHIATSALRDRRLETGEDPAEHALRTSVSIGVARLPTDGATPIDVLAVADRRLYEAKKAGRNRLIHGPD
jgi:diguanylate cyclase (GGDEF)-like protein